MVAALSVCWDNVLSAMEFAFNRLMADDSYQ
jgi:hypothetical protein